MEGRMKHGPYIIFILSNYSMLFHGNHGSHWLKEKRD